MLRDQVTQKTKLKTNRYGFLVFLLCNIGQVICEKEQQIVDEKLLGDKGRRGATVWAEDPES